jgi:hypothetical protein
MRITFIYLIIGLGIFFIYLLRSGHNRSLEITMELGIALAFLALAIHYSFSPLLQIAAIVTIVLLFLQKGFV